MAKKVKGKEKPRFKVQVEYESKFKANYQKMLATMSKSILYKVTHDKHAFKQSTSK